MDNLKDTAKKIFEEIQINKTIKEGFNGCTPQQRYEHTEKGRARRKRYELTDRAKMLNRERVRRCREKRKLLNSSFDSPE